MKKIIFTLLLSLVLVLAGCANVTNTVKVDKKGEAMISFDIDISSVAGIFASGYSNQVEAKLKEAGFTVDKKSNTSYHIEKKLAKDETTKSDMEPEDFGVKITNTKSFFTQKIKVDANIDIEKIWKKEVADVPFPKEILSQIDYTFILDLPVSSIGDNNAKSVDGGKLTWDVPLDQKSEMYFEVTVPNVKNIAIVGGILLVAIIGLLIYLIRKHRKKKRL
ncbi:TPA: EGFR-like transmembrane domain-containing protein [Listeria innocua]|uniref:Lin0817 protein n=1 Tax=Listeria innocua serovar 6a (strain ATCC BAA-680 / CLIP 11262) TaxID=272626 RepID=Q92DJ6_LISIN|nr:transmembrane domain-containing protein [Listeria innocua]ECC1682960.1 protein with hydrophobic anchor [Listeria innocua]ECR3484773.1 protein with hydrophobic anchor [Listeria innocua]EED2042408.1 protein with hydrophobic anchor [Listeria innocua]EEQ0535794.1 protein with hydrophobic anchor [Listeria innocua]EHD9218822.1 protein with hydrophobic anchor [Listeria innocua]